MKFFLSVHISCISTLFYPIFSYIYLPFDEDLNINLMRLFWKLNIKFSFLSFIFIITIWNVFLILHFYAYLFILSITSVFYLALYLFHAYSFHFCLLHLYDQDQILLHLYDYIIYISILHLYDQDQILSI